MLYMQRLATAEELKLRECRQLTQEDQAINARWWRIHLDQLMDEHLVQRRMETAQRRGITFPQLAIRRGYA
ncbi:MAG: hypothetical protein ACK2UA_05795 [Anaerolineae bacterium]